MFSLLFRNLDAVVQSGAQCDDPPACVAGEFSPDGKNGGGAYACTSCDPGKFSGAGASLSGRVCVRKSFRESLQHVSRIYHVAAIEILISSQLMCCSICMCVYSSLVHVCCIHMCAERER